MKIGHNSAIECPETLNNLVDVYYIIIRPVNLKNLFSNINNS